MKKMKKETKKTIKKVSRESIKIPPNKVQPKKKEYDKFNKYKWERDFDTEGEI